MSGGYFNYKDRYLKDEIFGYGPRFTNVFEDREISELVWDVLNLIHDYDWYESGDTSEKVWLNKKTEFKRKWFSNRGVRVRRIVDDALAQTREELYKTFGLEELE